MMLYTSESSKAAELAFLKGLIIAPENLNLENKMMLEFTQ